MKRALIAGLISLVVYAETDPPEKATLSEKSRPQSAEELQAPILSPTGKARLAENVRILEGNLKDLRQNLATTQANIETIQSEMRDLDDLEKEHHSLKRKYEQYLKTAEQEIRKNNTARRDLAKWEAAYKAAPKETADGALKDKLDAARLEQADRQRWLKDAEAKTAEVKTLLTGIQKNLGDLRSRRKPLQNQLSAWEKRLEEYKALIAETEGKKAQWENILSR